MPKNKAAFDAAMKKLSVYNYKPYCGVRFHDSVDSDIVDFRVFFALAGTQRFHIVPTGNIDKVWCRCIADTRFYTKLCKDVFGKFIHRVPPSNMQQQHENLKKLFARTGSVYKNFLVDWALEGEFGDLPRRTPYALQGAQL